MKVKIKRIENGRIPEFKHEDDACCDCYAREDITILSGDRKLIPLGFALELPKGYEALIRPRSGNSRNEIDVCLGTVDAGYRGEVMACVVNNTNENIMIEEGDRICQMAIREVPSVDFELCSELSDTERGDKGFGSTGV